ncbi:pyocin activator PrtN family protein [Pseudorhodobacter sp. W20_MBD10_FR17]|uniref:pyocin activator PrtN family protein n=1 Tax=Pseudorhodobacter sp. W20_MBD10_FR17 TaxID=3240266 RepID=UPI003F982FEC
MLYITSQQLNSNLVQQNGTFAMKTLFLLMARYEARPFLPIDLVREDFFDGMSRKVFLSKLESGEIRLPLTRLDEGQKAVKGIVIQDLAIFLDACSSTARKELARKRTITRSPLQFMSECLDTELN